MKFLIKSKKSGKFEYLDFWKNYFPWIDLAFCTCLSSGNQVDGLPLALHKDAVAASWHFFGRACDRRIRHIFRDFDDLILINMLVNHKNPNSLYKKASVGYSKLVKW